MSADQRGTPDARPISPPSGDDWHKLVVFLRQNAAAQPSAPDAAPPGFSNALTALHAVVGFLSRQQAFQDDPRSLWPVMELYTAMLGILRGTPSPMLTPTKKPQGGAPPGGIAFEAFKGIAAAALEELQAAGDSPQAAAMRVANACRTGAGQHRIEASTIKGWRDRFRQRPGRGAPKDGPGRMAYEGRLQLGDTPRERADNLLAELRRLPVPRK